MRASFIANSLIVVLANLGVKIEDAYFLGVDDGADRAEARAVVRFLVLAVLDKLPDGAGVDDHVCCHVHDDVCVHGYEHVHDCDHVLPHADVLHHAVKLDLVNNNVWEKNLHRNTKLRFREHI